MYNINHFTHPVFNYPKPDVAGDHPFLNVKNHEKLKEYVLSRVQSGKHVRDSQINRFVEIDKEVLGWLKLSKEDQKRKLKQYETGDPMATKMKLPMLFIQLDDLLTYFLQTFCPNRHMFNHSAKADSVEPSDELIALMNNHSIHANYFREFSQAIYQIIKYNLGGVEMEWSKDYGPELGTNIDGSLNVTEDKVVWAGNRVNYLDMYNTFIDPLVDPVLLHSEGEWAAKAYLKSEHWLIKKAVAGEIFMPGNTKQDRTYATEYYRHPPVEAHLNIDQSTGAINWKSYVAEVPNGYDTHANEILEVQIRLVPQDFGLVPKTRSVQRGFELWKLTYLNGKQLIKAQKKNNIHSHIPYYFGVINDDVFKRSTKSISEHLMPLQNFANFMVNLHVEGSRKQLGGLTIYDPTVVDYSKIPEGEVNAQLAIEPSGYGKDISTAIYKDQGSVDTERTIQDFQQVMNLFSQFFPAQMLPAQIADIDRAVSSQVAAVQQGANRRQHKSASLLDSVLFSPLRADMYYNIVQYQSTEVIVSDFRGQEITIQPGNLRSTNLPFIIGQGLKALDRMALADKMQNIIFAIIQAPAAQQNIDLLKMLGYWASMLDMDLDIEQFRAQPQLPPSQEVGQEAPIVPATNPGALTEPIYG